VWIHLRAPVVIDSTPVDGVLAFTPAGVLPCHRGKQGRHPDLVISGTAKEGALAVGSTHVTKPPDGSGLPSRLVEVIGRAYRASYR
jgi:hypothetical protein